MARVTGGREGNIEAVYRERGDGAASLAACCGEDGPVHAGGCSGCCPVLWCRYPALQEDEVEPAIEFVSDLPQVAGLLEPQAFVKADRRIVSRIDSRDHHMLAERPCARK